jgi:hypothetical protein
VAHGVHQVRDGFVGVVRSVVAGAVQGASAAAPSDRDRTLRAVVDGVGDGLQVTAQAATLALKEAAGTAKRHAREDVDKLAAAVRELSDHFVDTVKAGLAKGSSQTAAQATALAEHADVALRRALPSLQAALDAARADPVQLAQQAAAAGVGAARGAAGALFTELGKQLERLGAKLRRAGAGD